MPRITPFLWYDGQAEKAIKLYTSVFKNSKIISIKHWDEGSGFPKDQVMMGIFELDGQRFHAFDAGPHFKFTEATSFFVECENQEEIDHYWSSLTANGGQESQCGWLKDPFGLSWQIVPRILGSILNSPEKEKSARAFQAVMKMKKFDIAKLQAAFDGK